MRFSLLDKAIAEFIHRDMFAVFADKGAVIDHEFDGNGRFGECDRGELNDVVRIAEGVADGRFQECLRG